MATKNKNTVLIVLLFLIQYLGSSANEAPKTCGKCIKSKTGNYHHPPQMSLPDTSRTIRSISGLAPVFNIKTTSTSNSIELKRPEYSNTSHQNHHHQTKHAPMVSRVPRAAQKPESIESLRKKLKGEKQGKTADKLEKLKQLHFNQTKFRHTEPHVIGEEVAPNKMKGNKLQWLYEFGTAERRDPQVHPGAECNFEKDCRWSWKTDIQNGFVIASSHNLLVNESGPYKDADDNSNGKSLFTYCIFIVSAMC